MLGHVDYIIDKTQQSAYYEMESTKVNSLPPFLQQNAELAADAYAVNQSMELFLSVGFNIDKLNEKIAQYLKDEVKVIFLWNFAMYSHKRIFGTRKYKFSELDGLSHPPPSFRQHVAMGLVKTLVRTNSKNDALKNSIEDILRMSVLEVEKAFSEISEQPFNMDAYKFVFNPEVERYYARLKQAYSSVIADLEPYVITPSSN